MRRRSVGAGNRLLFDISGISHSEPRRSFSEVGRGIQFSINGEAIQIMSFRATT